MTPERMAELRRWYSPGGNRGPASAPEMNETLDALAAAEATIAELLELGDGMADCIGYFWKPSPCEHDGGECGVCEVERWGLLYEAAEKWRAALSGQPAGGDATDGEGVSGGE